jgi:hypothetical protein
VHSFLVNRVIEAVSGSAISQLILVAIPIQLNQIIDRRCRRQCSIKLLIVAADINAGVILTTPEFMIMSLILSLFPLECSMLDLFLAVSEGSM